MRKDPFLLGILIGILILIVCSLLIVLINHNNLTYQEPDTPEAVVNNFVTAWTLEDYEKVSSYLLNDPYQPNIQQIIQMAYESKYVIDITSIRIEKSILREDEATVVLTVIQQAGDPFSPTSQMSQLAYLIKQDGVWKIKQFPYPYWGWDWYQNPATPQK